jgi:cobalamin biosynthesis protein CbiD
MALPLERMLDNELNVAAGKIDAESESARARLEIFDEHVKEMRWYERAVTYLERRHERAELVREVDRAELRAEITHEIADTVRSVLHNQEQSIERERTPRNRADELEREI